MGSAPRSDKMTKEGSPPFNILINPIVSGVWSGTKSETDSPRSLSLLDYIIYIDKKVDAYGLIRINNYFLIRLAIILIINLFVI